MPSTTQLVHEKFTSLRKRLDQLGYKHPLGLDSLPLVERLFGDLVWTTESLRQSKTELESYLKIRGQVDEYVAPYKADNGRLIRENNEMHQNLIGLRQDYEERIKSLKTEYRQLENENTDLKYFNNQCLDKLKSYEREAKQMVDQILLLQEKNFQAVVYTPGGRKKQLAFRRQRMDIDSLVPQTKASVEKDSNYCCSVAQHWESTIKPEKLDLLDLATRRCEDLQKQLIQLEEELELGNRKVENFRQQVNLRDTEIERLRALCETGRPLECLVQNTNETQSERLIQQLQLQVDLLQSSNEELESRVLQLVNHELTDPKLSPDMSDQGCQTTIDLQPKPDLSNSSCQTTLSVLVEQSDSLPVTKQDIGELLEKWEQGREYLVNRVNSLISRERDLINELSTRSNHCRQTTPNELISNAIDPTLIEALNQRLIGLEKDVCHWRSEAKIASESLASFLKRLLNNTADEFRTGDCNTSASVHKFSFISRRTSDPDHVATACLRRRSNSAESRYERRVDKILQNKLNEALSERDQYRCELDRLRYDLVRNSKCRSASGINFEDDKEVFSNEEIRRLRKERDELASLLDTFERQLHDIQGNVRLLTQERKILIQRLCQTKSDLSDVQDRFIQSELSRNSTYRRQSSPSVYGNLNPSTVASHIHSNISQSQRPPTLTQSILKQVQTERDQALSDMHSILMERDSLKDQLHDLTSINLTEKARLLQRIEDRENELELLKQTYGCLEKKLADLTCHLVNLESERDQLANRLSLATNPQRDVDQNADLKQHLQVAQSSLERIQSDYEKSRSECDRLRGILRQLDQEKDQLQSGLDERTERCAMIERELSKKENQLRETQRVNQTIEQRLKRLSEVIMQRETESSQLTEHIGTLETELKQMKQFKDALALELEQSKNDLKTIIRDSQRWEAERLTWDNNQSNLMKQVDELSNELNQLRELNSAKEVEKNDLLKEYRALTQELDEKTILLGRIQSQLNDSTHRNSIQEQELISSHMQIDALKKENTQYRQTLDTLKSQCGLLTQNNTETEDRIRHLQVENEDLCRELTDMRALCNRLERQAQTSQSQLASASLEQSQLKAQLTEAEYEIGQLRKRLDHERDTFRNLETVLAASRESEHKAHLDARNAMAELLCLKERVTDHNASLSERDREIQGLNRRLSDKTHPISEQIAAKVDFGSSQRHQPAFSQVQPRLCQFANVTNPVIDNFNVSNPMQQTKNSDDGYSPSTRSFTDNPNASPLVPVYEEDKLDSPTPTESTLIPNWPSSSISNSTPDDIAIPSLPGLVDFAEFASMLMVHVTHPTDLTTQSQPDDSGRPRSTDTLSEFQSQ